MDTKRCSKCDTVKLVSEFYKRNKGDGYQIWCKRCQNDSLNRRWRENPDFRDKRLDYDRRRHQDPVKRERWNTWRLRRLHTDPEFRAVYRFYNKRKKNRYRALMRAAGKHFTLAEWRALCAKYEYRCLCCGQVKPLTADHIVPVSKGGSNAIDNIQPLCIECNQHKSSKEIDYRPSSG